MSKRFDALGFPLNSVQRWAADADEKDREIAAETARRRAHERAQVEAEAAQQRAAFEPRVAELEAEVAHLQQAVVDVTRVTTDLIEDLTEQRGNLAKAERDELRDLKVEVAKLTSVMTELRGSADGFKFAREKEALTDLPAFLPPRRDPVH
jgi:hypothetical protein